MIDIPQDADRFHKEVFEDEVYKVDIPANAIVLDIGGHVGTYTEYISPKVKWVYTIEPDTANYEKLVSNTIGLRNVTTYNMALSDYEGKGTLSTYSSDGGYELNNIRDDPKNREEVVVTTLAEFMNTAGIDHVDILKIDCEGSEREILKDGFPYEKVDCVVGEIHGDTPEAYLKKVGYDYKQDGGIFKARKINAG